MRELVQGLRVFMGKTETKETSLHHSKMQCREGSVENMRILEFKVNNYFFKATKNNNNKITIISTIMYLHLSQNGPQLTDLPFLEEKKSCDVKKWLTNKTISI